LSETPVLEIKQLTGGYSIGKPVLHDVTFDVKPGEMVGLIGLNGAGKSTTMKHVLGLMTPHQGNILIQGSTKNEAPDQYQSSLAFVPESPLLYEELTVREHLEFAARAYGIDQQAYKQRAEELLKLFRMEEKADSLSMHLSKGMKQKVMIMCAFVARPPLYIIDEPFLGLDPLGIRSLLEFMKQIRDEGASILLSSHILSTIEGYCDRFIVLHRGAVIAQGTLENIGEQTEMRGATLENMFYALVKDGE
jgi:ABC-2 type transport system ATP-binding protein